MGRRQAALDKGIRSVPGQLAKRLSWQDTASIFDTSWDTVYRAVGMAVDWDRARISLEGVTALGEDRKIETLASFLKWFATKRTGQALHVLDRFHVAGKLDDDRQGARCRGPRVESARRAAAPHALLLAAAKAPRTPSDIRRS